MRKLAASPLPLLGVLLLALALRVWGLTWGLPSATHYFSYHPDESVVLEAASITMNPLAGHLLPHFYRYGSLQLYLVSFANTLAALFGLVDIVPKNFAVWYPQWAKMYLTGRLLTVGMGIGTVWAVYGIGRRLWGRRAGLLAALTLAMVPLHAQHSHFLTVDVPATFWGTLSLLWAVRLATGDPKPLRAALWAGVFAGLATATKYNLALAILPLVVACFMAEPTRFTTVDPPGSQVRHPPGTGGIREVQEEKQKPLAFTSSPSRIGRVASLSEPGGFLLSGLAASVLAFFLACPGAILEHARFLADLRFEAVHVQNVDDPTFRDTGNGFVYHIARNLDAGLGLPLLLLALASVGYALYRRERGDGLLAAFALPYYVLISLAAVRYARYTIPMLPILALWVGRMVADGSRLPYPSLQRAIVGVGAAALLFTLTDAIILLRPMAEMDIRDKALLKINQPSQRYFGATAASGSLKAQYEYPHIGFASQPWFGTPPLSPYFSMPRPGAWREVTPPEIMQRIVYSGKDWDTNSLQTEKPDAVVLSEYDYDDALRLNDPIALAWLQALKQDYRLVVTSADGDKAVGGMPTHALPHDMLYTNPVISIYQRKH